MNTTTEKDTKMDTTETAEETKTEDTPRRLRGFAGMDRAKVAEIASKGGKAAHATGNARHFTTEEARIAGKKGGSAPHIRRGKAPKSA